MDRLRAKPSITSLPERRWRSGRRRKSGDQFYCTSTSRVAELTSRYLLHAETYYTKNGTATSQLTIVKLTIGVLLDRYAHLEVREFGPLSLIACQEAFVATRLSRGEVNRRVWQAPRWTMGATQESTPSNRDLVTPRQEPTQQGERDLRQREHHNHIRICHVIKHLGMVWRERPE